MRNPVFESHKRPFPKDRLREDPDAGAQMQELHPHLQVTTRNKLNRLSSEPQEGIHESLHLDSQVNQHHSQLQIGHLPHQIMRQR